MNPTGAPLPLDAGPVVARVVPDVTGIDRHFDYLVPDALRDLVEVGSMVRVPLHGRRVGGWVVELGIAGDDIASDVPVDRLVPIAKWSGRGPAAEIVDLARWAAVRWGSTRLRPFLVAASPPTMVTRPVRGATLPPTGGPPPASGVRRLPPLADPLPLLTELAAAGPLLVVHPAAAAARAIARRLSRTGLRTALLPEQWALAWAGVDVVVGTRVAVWGPCPGMRCVVVLDEHDDALQEERTPTWHARDVAIERGAREGAGCVLVSPVPTVTALHWTPTPLVRVPLGDERAGWPMLEVVDRSDEVPWKRSLLTSALITHLRVPDRQVVCVLNTVGRARLVACRACRALQRCERCAAAVALDDAGAFVCPRCATARPAVCQRCGSGAMAVVRPGVTRLREELEAAAGRPVAAVTGRTDELPVAGIHIGTEAVLHRVRRADVVAFLDFDAELLAPRYRAAEQAIGLVVRAARLVGRRDDGGRVLLQTFEPDHEVVRAAVLADPGRVAAAERTRRELLGLPPFGALAVVEGDGAEPFARATGLEVAPTARGVLLRAVDWTALGEALARTPRPAGSRLRIEVDPPRR